MAMIEPKTKHARLVAIANQKGGVGKTTTAVNLAASLSSLGKRVLLVDLDAQGNATSGSGLDKRRLERHVYHLLVQGVEAETLIHRCQAGKYDVLPSNRDLAAAEIELVNMEGREYRLKQALEPLRSQYDYILLDCPPALNLITVNAFVAAQGVLIPHQCEYYALEGLIDLLHTMDKLRENLNPTLALDGVVRTLFDSRSTLAQQVAEQLQSYFPEALMETFIPRNVRLAEAPSHGVPILVLDKKSKGAVTYLALAQELLARYAVRRPAS
jgi:chromosome partitioning protein